MNTPTESTQAAYKVWHVSYRWTGHFSTYNERDYIVIAEREDKAIGMVVQENIDLDADMGCWSATEIRTDEQNVHHISSSES